jgi:hypothetical protein
VTVDRSTRWLGWSSINFGLTILLSAFLLFQVQPLISKFILPWFGGTPAVWTTCMLFFQILLFFGYAYAHLTHRRLAPPAQAWLHLALLVLAILLLPIAPDAHWQPADPSNPTARILFLLAVNVGVPYCVLSSTGPLVQAWFGRAYPGKSPYRLYALSNLGSLLALLSYPILFEPAFDVSAQAKLWGWGFGLFAVACAILAIGQWRQPRERSAAIHEPSPIEGKGEAAPTLRLQFRWLGLPACASLMLLATTNHVCQDVAVIPFLWIAPLSVYLLSFIIAFDHERWYARRVFALLTAVLTLAVAGMRPLERLCDEVGLNFGSVHQLVVYFAALFCICMLCHGELVNLRPSPRYLTQFYLLVAAGGALGGVLVSLIAPAVFSSFVEWRIGLMLSFVVGAVVLFRFRSGMSWRDASLRFGLISAVAGVACVEWLFRVDDEPAVESARNFYGVVGVTDSYPNDPSQRFMSLTHGIVIHGRQFVAPEKRRLPVTYFGPLTGVGRTLQHFGKQADMRVGTIGLGVGTIAAYVGPGQYVRFYEINPEVRRLAEKHFSYLRDCAGRLEIIAGDARLSLEREPPQHFHVLVLDAFAGDAPPVHLLTQEAFAIYLRHLRPDGALAINITNRHIDLVPVVFGLAKYYGLQSVRISSEPDEDRLWYRADWMVVSRNSGVIAALHGAEGFVNPSAAARSLLWTDRFSNLVAILK